MSFQTQCTLATNSSHSTILFQYLSNTSNINISSPFPFAGISNGVGDYLQLNESGTPDMQNLFNTSIILAPSYQLGFPIFFAKNFQSFGTETGDH